MNDWLEAVGDMLYQVLAAFKLPELYKRINERLR
jgi:hypothetical protein